MSGVDVLAVLDQAIQREKDAGQSYVAQVAARAAVAELIEADRECDEAKAEHDDHAKFDEFGMYVPRAVYARMEAATGRRAAALRRLQGGSA